MESEVASVHEKIRLFKRRYYLDMLVRGLLLSLSILVVYFLTAAVVEYNFWLGPSARFVAFSSFFIVAIFCIIKFLKEPLQWWIANRGLSEEESARLIGQYIPVVKDHLLNFVQLEFAQNSNSLAAASLLQKTREFAPMSFESVIDIRQNKRYLKYLMLPLAIVLIIVLIDKNIITRSTARIINFNEEFSPEAPFDFILENKDLTAFYNENFTVNVNLVGSAVPDNAYLITRGLRLKLVRQNNGTFSYTFEKLQTPVDFQIEAAGFFSGMHKITLNNRPELSGLSIELQYPRYLHKKNEVLTNPGNIEVPEGTQITWNMHAAFTDEVVFSFADSSQLKAQSIDNQAFALTRTFKESSWYAVDLANRNSHNKDQITYSIDVVKDQFPSITVSNLKDSILYKRIFVGGAVSDDHGLTDLKLIYSAKNDQQKTNSGTIRISLASNDMQQSFFFDWAIDSLKLSPGMELEYYLQVWDNDGVNGRKSTRSSTYTFLVPTEESLMVNIKNSEQKTNEKIEQSVGQAKKLQDQIDQAAEKLKGKQTMSWQDKKNLEDILKQKESLNKAIDELKQQNKQLNEKKEAFTEQDERIKEKAEQIQKLMDELLDEETKKLFEELQKMLQENADINEIQKMMDKLNQNTSNLEKELERTLELFKELKYEFKVDQMIDNLSKQIEQQDKLGEKTNQLEKEFNKSGKSDQELQKDAGELAKEQDEIKQQVQQNAEQLKEIKELSEELHNDDPLPADGDFQEIQDEMDKSQEQLDKGQPSNAKSPQRNAAQKMKEMKQKMESMQSSMSMEIDMHNLESLRQIVHGLVKLSFDQESLLKHFNDLNQSDPRFNAIAQSQIKLKDDVKVLEDSLTALAKKDPFMGSIVTKEVGELKSHIANVIEANRERRKPQASTEMQASMTSLNNLALMLDDHLQMMMEMMANAKASMGKQNKQKKDGQKPGLSQLQKQLNQRIEELKNSGKSGKELSEELAQLAAEQERIRKALQEMQEKLNKQNGTNPGDQLPGKMEQTEMDLVNKQLSDQLIRRQKEILTRLLETEKSAREQDMDEERKGETAKDYDKEIPKAFEEYLRLKEKEVELLKTVPPKLYPYYKKEVSEYFKRMGN